MRQGYKNRKGGSGGDRRRGGNFKGRGASKSPSIRFEQLEHEGVPLEDVRYDSPRTFEEMPLHPKLKANIRELGYEMPTEIQDKTFVPRSRSKSYEKSRNGVTSKSQSKKYDINPKGINKKA